MNLFRINSIAKAFSRQKKKVPNEKEASHCGENDHGHETDDGNEKSLRKANFDKQFSIQTFKVTEIKDGCVNNSAKGAVHKLRNTLFRKPPPPSLNSW